MKNIFKKTAGVMLASSMLCAVMATGCGKEVSDTTDKNAGASSATSSANSEPAQQTTDKSVEASSEIDYENLEFAQQTLVDKVTGIQVTGMLPVGAELLATVDIISAVDLYDVFDSPYSLEGDFKEFTGPILDYEAFQADRKTENISKIINQEDWAQWEGYGGGMMNVEVYFVMGTEVLEFESEFESDITVTMPFNYRRGLATGGITDEAVVVHYDYDNNEFVDIELVSEEDTSKGMFQFKTKNTGLFFMGGNSNIDELMEFYENHYE